MKYLYGVLISNSLTGDSQVIFTPSLDKAKEHFHELINPLLEICENELNPSEYEFNEFSFQFEAAVNEKLGDTEMRYSYFHYEVNDDITHYLAVFTENVFNSWLEFHTEENCINRYNQLVETDISYINNTIGDAWVTRDNKSSWTDEEGNELFSELTENEKTEASFTYEDSFYTYRVAPIK
jgi:hypothetical protein